MKKGAESSERAGRIGFVISALALWAMVPRFRADPAAQDLIAQPAGIVLSVVIAAALLLSLAAWNISESRRPFLWSVLITATLDTALLMVAEHVGWLGGIAFRPSLALQVVVYGAAFVGFVAVPLAIYRVLARRRMAYGLAAYAAIVIALSVATFPVEQDWLEKGIYVFDHGYSIAWDTTWGAAQFLLALLIYEGLRRRPARSMRQSSSRLSTGSSTFHNGR